jgi:hypothetical protein
MSSLKGRVEEKVEITMTATKRKHLTFKTISSFMENLLYICDDVEVIINVDDVGESGPRETTLKIIELFVPVKVSRFSETPNFSTAFAFCWQQVEADWVVHLEDDWELLQKVDVREMMAILKEEEDLALLRLPQFRSGEDKMKNWDKFFPWNGKYFECPDELRQGVGFCGHPSLIKGEFVRACAPLINVELNPEKQFHGDNPELVAEVMKWRYGVYSKPNEPNYIQDLGRQWMVDNGFRKKGSKAWFTEWETVK